jgi:hypothetical protein
VQLERPGRRSAGCWMRGAGKLGRCWGGVLMQLDTGAGAQLLWFGAPPPPPPPFQPWGAQGLLTTPEKRIYWG